MASPSVGPPPGAMNGQGPSSDSPQMNEGTSKVIQVVSMVRQLAKDNPGIADEVQKINDLLQKVQMKIMQKSKPTEPAAPPV